MTTTDDSVDIVEVVRVLRLADAGWPDDRGDWDTHAFASAAWNGFLTEEVTLTEAGRTFLTRYGFLCREA